MTAKKQAKKRYPSLLNKNCQYMIDYDYDSHYPEDSEYGRGCTITNIRVKSVSLLGIVQKIISNIKLSAVEKYCVERILVAHKLYETSSWNLQVVNGYYGEEIGGATFEDACTVDSDLAKMINLKTDTEKITFVLECEYGYLLEELKGKKFVLTTVSKDEIIFGQSDHYRHLDKTVVNLYREYNGPRGICLKVGDKYRIIDGYHRCAALETGKKAQVFVAV